MSVDAFVTLMGKGRPKRWAFEDEASWRTACQREETFLQGVEFLIEKQLGKRVRLVGTALDGTLPPTGGQSDLQLTVPVGGTDGIAPIQLLPVSYKVEHKLPVNWRVADINWPNRIVNRSTYRELLRDFLHLVDHDPISGFYLPVDFPDPIWLPGKALNETNDVSIGSAVQLLDNLQRWSKLVTTLREIPKWLIVNAKNLALVARAAIRTGLAVELA
jgi:hypothetical protein